MINMHYKQFSHEKIFQANKHIIFQYDEFVNCNIHICVSCFQKSHVAPLLTWISFDPNMDK